MTLVSRHRNINILWLRFISRNQNINNIPFYPSVLVHYTSHDVIVIFYFYKGRLYFAMRLIKKKYSYNIS